MTFTSLTELRYYLQANADEDKARFEASLIPNLQRTLYGWRTPKLRALAKKMASSDAIQALTILQQASAQEEVVLRGLIIGYSSIDDAEWWKQIGIFVPQIDNWAICDTVCASFTRIRKRREAGWHFLLPYLKCGKEMPQRFAVVMLLDHYLIEEYIGFVLQAIVHLKPAGYYAAMAGGWLLQAAFAKFPDQVFPMLTDTSIDYEIRRLARKKILESLRTTDFWRSKIKAIKL